LHPGASLATAAAQADAVWASLTAERPLADTPEHLRVAPFWRSPTGGQTYMLPSLVVLSAMGLLVLLIACANIAGLVLVRGVSRRGEIAVRLSLGAPRRRIVRLLVVENLLLAVPGAILGVMLASNGIPVLLDYAEWLAAPQRLFFNIAVDSLVIGFAAVVGAVSALVFGLVPALQSTRVDLMSAISQDASPRSAGRGRVRAGLVVAQVAVSLLLLVGAGLATRSLDAARHAYPGFDPSHVASVELDVKQNGYDAAAGRVFYRKLVDAVRADSGVESVTLAAYHPLGLLDTRAQRVTIEGYDPRRDEDLAFMSNTVGPDYFGTLRIPVLAGRAFDDRDVDGAEPVVMVNRALAERFWGGANRAVGQRLRMADDHWRRVVGVAADLKYSRINEGPRPYVYLPFFQAYRANMILHVRGPAPIDVLVDGARTRVTALDADLPIVYARPFVEMIKGAFIFYEFTATLLLVFGAAGMVLAAMGTYGLVSYAVRQSTHEIGIRMALGASRASVVRGFLGRGLRLGAAGTVLGVAAAFGATRLLGNVLFGVSATDPMSFTGALAVVLGGVAAATVVPAWRAAQTDPLRALRHQ
jgi:predicted permease